MKKLQIRRILFLILLGNVVCCNPVSTESLFYLWTQQLIGLFTIRFHSFVQHVPQLSTQIQVSISNDAWIFSMESVKKASWWFVGVLYSHLDMNYGFNTNMLLSNRCFFTAHQAHSKLSVLLSLHVKNKQHSLYDGILIPFFPLLWKSGTCCLQVFNRPETTTK